MLPIATLPPSIELAQLETRFCGSAHQGHARVPPRVLIERLGGTNAEADISQKHTPSSGQAVPREANWRSALNIAVAHLRSLKPGWDGVGSSQISRSALFRAETLVVEALGSLEIATPPYLVPTGSGGVQVEWHEKGAELEFTIEPDGQTSFWTRSHVTGQEIEAEGDKAVTQFARWAPRLASGRRNGHDVLSSESTLLAVAA